MSIDAIAALPTAAFEPAVSFLPSAASLPSLAPQTATPAASGAFASWFGEQLAQTNAQLTSADHGIQQLALGDASNLHHVMIQLEEAKLSLQLVMQVRNHLLDAYRELMQMQV